MWKSGVFAFLLALGSCTTFAEHYGMTEEQWKARVARQPASIQSLITHRQLQLGMTKEQVLLSMGRPTDVNRTVSASGTDEQWVYGTYNGTYLYFEHGQLTAIQD